MRRISIRIVQQLPPQAASLSHTYDIYRLKSISRPCKFQQVIDGSCPNGENSEFAKPREATFVIVDPLLYHISRGSTKNTNTCYSRLSCKGWYPRHSRLVVYSRSPQEWFGASRCLRLIGSTLSTRFVTVVSYVHFYRERGAPKSIMKVLSCSTKS
jgi:hypothetical protein